MILEILICLNFFQDCRPCAWFCGATGGPDATSLWQFNEYVTIMNRQNKQIQPQKTTALRCSLGLLYHCQCWVGAAFVICHEIHLIERCFFFAVWQRRLKHECFVYKIDFPHPMICNFVGKSCSYAVLVFTGCTTQRNPKSSQSRERALFVQSVDSMKQPRYSLPLSPVLQRTGQICSVGIRHRIFASRLLAIVL